MMDFDEAFLEYFDNEDYYNELPFEEFGDYASVTFRVDDKDKGIKISQKDAFIYFYENQEKVINALCLGVIQAYSKLMEIYDQTEFDDDYFPEVKTIEDVQKVIGLNSLYILEDELENFAYYGIGGGCTWDEEHGFGVIMYKDEVIEIGDVALAFSGSVEIYKHKNDGSYEEHLEWWKNHNEELKQRREKEAEETQKNAQKNAQKWWQFWK